MRITTIGIDLVSKRLSQGIVRKPEGGSRLWIRLNGKTVDLSGLFRLYIRTGFAQLPFSMFECRDGAFTLLREKLFD